MYYHYTKTYGGFTSQRQPEFKNQKTTFLRQVVEFVFFNSAQNILTVGNFLSVKPKTKLVSNHLEVSL